MDEIQMEKYFIMSLPHLLFPILHKKKTLEARTKNQNNDEGKKIWSNWPTNMYVHVGNPN